ncbi:MAG: DUF1570 domain-containing protein [Planctomycetes bacterium]|nr:DUF1570 domain-containing protein [Planctomycetota bacterium]
MLRYPRFPARRVIVALLAVLAVAVPPTVAAQEPPAAAAPAPVRGVVILKDGRRLAGEIREFPEVVEVRTKIAAVRVQRAEIERIEPEAAAGGPAPAPAAGAASPAPAAGASGVVTLKSGARFEGVIREEGDDLVVETPTRKVRVKRAEVATVERKQLPAETLAAELARTPPDAVDALYRLAHFAWDNDLRAEYRSLLERILAVRPDHGPAAKELTRFRKFFERLPLPAAEEAALVKTFGKGFRTVRSDHYVVVYDTDESFALGRLSFLEKLYTTFYPYFEDRGFDTAVLPRPLVAAVFASDEEYTARGGPQGSGGVYMPDRGQLWLFDSRKTDTARTVVGVIDTIDAEIGKVQERLALARTPKEKAELAGKLAEMKEIQLYNRLARRQTSAAGATDTLLHEGFHQISHQGAVLGMTGDFPLWLTEGFAEYWGRSEGWTAARGLPGSLQSESVAVIRSAIVKGKHIPLVTVMKYTNQQNYLGLGNEGAALAYAEAWSLVHFMIQRRAGTQAQKFFDWVRLRSRAGKPTPESAVALDAAARAAFGEDPEALEQEWVAYVRSLN